VVKYTYDWNGFLPEEARHEVLTRRMRRALQITPVDAEPFVMHFEWDDGNGMWINVGVSRDLSTT